MLKGNSLPSINRKHDIENSILENMFVWAFWLCCCCCRYWHLLCPIYLLPQRWPHQDPSNSGFWQKDPGRRKVKPSDKCPEHLAAPHSPLLHIPSHEGKQVASGRLLFSLVATWLTESLHLTCPSFCQNSMATGEQHIGATSSPSVIALPNLYNEYFFFLTWKFFWKCRQYHGCEGMCNCGWSIFCIPSLPRARLFTIRCYGSSWPTRIVFYFFCCALPRYGLFSTFLLNSNLYLNIATTPIVPCLPCG